jgi:hypothetical protein
VARRLVAGVIQGQQVALQEADHFVALFVLVDLGGVFRFKLARE